MCLSATVSNAEEVAAWIETVRGQHRGHHRGAPPGDARAPLPRGRAGRRPAAPAADVRRRARRRAPPQPRRRPPRRPQRPRPRLARPAPHPAAHPEPGRDRRAARGGVDAARHRVHLQPQGLRPGGASSAWPPGCASPSPTSGPRSATIADAKTAGLADDDLDVLRYDQWLAGLEAGFAAHHAGMVPPMKEAVEEAFAGGPGEGGVRHRDARARHQHAGALGRHREAVEVHRRAPRVPHAGGVHPAHRAGRPARHRRARLRHRVLEPVRAVRPGGVVGVAAQRRAAVVVPARPTTWRPTSSAGTRSSRPTTCSTCRSRSSTPTATS